MEVIIRNLGELNKFAAAFVESLAAKSIICLRGDLGAGKTTLARDIIRYLVGNQNLEATSPTFNLVHVHDSRRGKIWHFDLYRLKCLEEVYELGIEDAFNNIAIIEWPEIIEGILPNKRIDIFIKFTENDDCRKIYITMLPEHD